MGTVVSLTATEFNSFVFPVLCFTASYVTKNFVIVTLNDCCLLPANLSYKIIYLWNLEFRMH